MQAGLTDRVWTFEDLANMIDGMILKPAKHGPTRSGYDDI
jgi:hypothetical protein